MHLARFPRRRYTPFATPVEKLSHLTRHLGGPEIYIKRDDLLGLAAGGNKTRKLEFLVADALAQGADTLITVGAVQSNHCRLTLAAAVREGLKCRLVLEQRVPGSYDAKASGNNFLFDLSAVESVTVVDAGADLAGAMQAIAADLQRQGRRVYVIPGGGSNALGRWLRRVRRELLAQTFSKADSIHRRCERQAGTHSGLLTGLVGNNARIR
jgi:D-cysteine desulfhydrase